MGLAVSLDGTRLELGETRARLDGDALRLDTVVSTRRFPLDAAHLRPFLDAETLATLLEDARLNHRCQVVEGPGATDSAAMLREFFRAKRGSGK